MRPPLFNLALSVSERAIKALRVALQTRQKCNEAWIAAEIRELDVVAIHGITREPVICRRLQPAHGLSGLFIIAYAVPTL